MERVCDYFRSEETVENRTIALLAYLPNWKGFLVDGAGEEMIATDALLALDKVVHSMTNVWVKQRGYRPEEKAPASNFDICKVTYSRIKAVLFIPVNAGEILHTLCRFCPKILKVLAKNAVAKLLLG